MPTVIITVLERSSDQFISETGQGMPDDTPVTEVTTIVIACSPYTSAEGVDSMVQDALDNYGVGQWDGGSNAYDPDGTSMSMDGTYTERFARIERS